MPEGEDRYRWNDDGGRKEHDQGDHSPIDVAEALREIAHDRGSLRLASGESVNRGSPHGRRSWIILLWLAVLVVVAAMLTR
jgi:hypothetical protein